VSVFQGWIIKNAAIRKMDVHLLRTRIGTKLLGLFICSGSSMKKGCEVKICSYTHKRNLCLDPSNAGHHLPAKSGGLRVSVGSQK
jgi:hypothetical protein